MAIALIDILSLGPAEDYKLHLASRNADGVHPLEEFVEDRERWVAWNSWRGNRDDWTRPFILSFMQYYPRPNGWLFGGIFRVVDRPEDEYVIEEVEGGKPYVGRLVCSFERYRGMRGRAFYLEHYLPDIAVLEILPEVYSGEAFPGIEWINHSFGSLATVFRTGRQDWRGALESTNAVYLISDDSNGKLYVGAAYGEGGLWGRWGCYMGTQHGWNDRLVEVCRDDSEYALKNFRFSVLETLPKVAPDGLVQARESHWKEALGSRVQGYNAN